MARILDRVPIDVRDGVAFVRGEYVTVKAYEVIVWISLGPKELPEWDPRRLYFPAILDTAHTHNFSIQEEHLVRWAGLQPERLRVLGTARQGGRRVFLRAANVWIHRNRTGKRDQLLDSPPYRLELPRGIAVYPAGSGYPRLPLLGSRAIVNSDLQLLLDGWHQQLSLHTPTWLSWLLRWLHLPPW